MAGTVVICFTDIVGSTELLTSVGDDAFDDVRRRHFDTLERQVDAHGGELVKTLGDGVMTAFGSASDAVSAGVAMQQAVTAAGRASESEIASIRVGISAGDAVQEDDDWFGVPVVESARLCAAAAPGQILVSEVVRLLAGNRGGHEFRSLGTLELKGLPEPVAAAEVEWSPVAATLVLPLPGSLAPDERELPFSGREAALTELEGEWKAAAAGERRAVMISGEPGVGKTRLVAELARTVHGEGGLVLLGRTEGEFEAPYAPWREALRALVAGAPDELLEQHVAEHGGELARVVRELALRVEGLVPPVVTDPETERLLFCEAVTGLLCATSREAPVLLVLDDLHWADRSSLQLLLHVVKADTDAALFVIGAYRDTDVNRTHPLFSALAEFRRIRGVSRLSLEGIDGVGMETLLTRAGGHELDATEREFAARLWRETDGNPFFIVEVLRHLTETGALVQVDGQWRADATVDQPVLPEGVREVIGRRLTELPKATNTVLGIASVLGREFEVALVAEVANEPVETVLSALEPAEQAQLISDVPGRPGRYSFAHALVRAVLVDELGTNRRVRLHRATGIALEARPDVALGELAYHFREAAVMGESERAARYATAAAEQALELVAPDEAVRLVRSAIDIAELEGKPDGEQGARRALLGRALHVAGAREEADATLADAFDRAEKEGDVDTACAAALAYGGLGGVWNELGEGRNTEQIRTALSLLPTGDSAPRARLLGRLAEWLMMAPGDAGARAARDAYDCSVRVGDRRAQQVAATTLGSTMRSVDPPLHLRFSREAVDLTPVDELTDVKLAAYLGIAEARLALGDIAGADTALDQLSDAYDRSGLGALEYYRTWVAYNVGGVRVVEALVAGRFDEAERCIDLLDPIPTVLPSLRVCVTIGRAQLAHLRGDWAEAYAGWEATVRVAPKVAWPYFGYAPVGAPLADVQREFADYATREPEVPAWTKPSNTGVMAEGLRRLRDQDASAALAAEFAPHADYYLTNGPMWFYGPFATALGVLSMTADDLGAAVTFLRRAIERCEHVGSPTFGAIARLELATALHLRGAEGDDAAAVGVSADARRLAEQVGMPGWIERIDRLDAGDLEPWRLPGD